MKIWDKYSEIELLLLYLPPNRRKYDYGREHIHVA